MKVIAKLAVILAALGLLSGCGWGPSTLNLSDKTSALTAAAPQPAQGTAIKIVSVDDARVFQVDPPSPDIPSLKSGAITDKAVTARAIGRKRHGTLGMALDNVFLEPGDTVNAHVAAALADGFRQAGYRVLKSGDAGYDQAVPVSATILKYWSWQEFGFVAQLNCRAEVKLDTPLPGLAPATTVMSQAKKDEAMTLDSAWLKINQLGLQALSAKLAETLKAKAPGS